jgi:hypothetical protein
VSEVVPVLRQLEQPHSIPEDQRGAALSYLEVLWLDARMRAADTDAAHAKLTAIQSHDGLALFEKAQHYHAAVRRQRRTLDRRISRLAWSQDQTDAHEHASF